jgi:ferrochelatase
MIDALLVQFGGPRAPQEILPFLTELLTDRDVIRTKLPPLIQHWIFRKVARKRSAKIRLDYEKIGGSSPIYFDTEKIAEKLRLPLQIPVITFHRYLPSTHSASLQKLEASTAQEIRVLPLFPQFCYATTGSIARFFSQNLSRKTLNKLRWIKSYSAHPSFVQAHQKNIAQFLKRCNIREEETALLFSAHGVPISFIEAGDIYQSECELSFRAILKGFPKALGRLSYQSQFGPEEWIRPYTEEISTSVLDWSEKRKHIVFIPLSFTSDHIETLFEIEHLYLPLVQKQGLNALRCPALNLEPYWIEALCAIFHETNLCNTEMLIR